MLFTYFSNQSNTIHLIRFTWTSPYQKVSYMVVMGHFIDDNEVMYKRILNFRRIYSHNREDMGRLLLDCTYGQGIRR